MESLSDKLKSLGVKIGAGQIARPAPVQKTGFAIEDVIKGEYRDTPFGQTFVIQTDYANDYVHGDIPLCQQVPLEILFQWGKIVPPQENPLGKILFLDTETSGLAGGTGTFAFLVGLGFWTESGFRVIQLFMRDPGEEEALLASLQHFVYPFTTLVTFNGKSFDIPLLNSRHVMHAMSAPFGEMGHLDLLHLARRIWKNRLPSRALGDLEIEILGMGRSQNEVPGWLVPQIYFDYLHTHDARPLDGVIYHNCMDIVSLAALFNHTAKLLDNPQASDEMESLDIIAIAKLYEDLGMVDQALDLYETGLNLGLPVDFIEKTILRYAAIYKKQNDFAGAVSLWERAAEHGSLDACLELAKYFEHTRSDAFSALMWTEKAEEGLLSARIPPYLRRARLAELDRRRTRLKNKIEK